MPELTVAVTVNVTEEFAETTMLLIVTLGDAMIGLSPPLALLTLQRSSELTHLYSRN